MYKLRIEISPWSKLSPRHYISAPQFAKIRRDKTQQIGGKRCEACGLDQGKIELHESFILTTKSYKFEGFVFLCQQCHDIVHYYEFSRCGEVFEGPYAHFDRLGHRWSSIPNLRKFSIYKSEAEFKADVLKKMRVALQFTFSDEIKVSYKKAEQWGLDPLPLEKKYHQTCNHLRGQVRAALHMEVYGSVLRSLVPFHTWLSPIWTKAQALTASYKPFMEGTSGRDAVEKRHQEFIALRAIQVNLQNAGFQQRELKEMGFTL